MKIPEKLIIIALLFICCSCSTGKLICVLSLDGPVNGKELRPTRRMVEGRYPGINAWYDSLRLEGVFKDTVIMTEDGVNLHAVYAGKEDGKDAVVLFHGYGVNHIAMLHFARLYRDSLDFNVIVPDLRHHGQSGGESVTMGVFDCRDGLRWVEMAHSIWNSDFVMAHGVSMGAATTMMMSGLGNLPGYLRCFVEDCGYTSVWDEFESVRVNYTPFGKNAVREANDYCLETYGWDFRSVAPIYRVADCSLPTLFIHGNPDNFVPTESVYSLFNAKKRGYKDIWISEGTKQHAVAYLTNMQAYTDRVRSFIRKVKELDAIPE